MQGVAIPIEAGRPRAASMVPSRPYAPDDSAWWSGFSASDVWPTFQRPDSRLYHAVTAAEKGIRARHGPCGVYRKPGIAVQTTGPGDGQPIHIVGTNGKRKPRSIPAEAFCPYQPG